MLEVQSLRQTLQHPHEVPAGQEVCPEVERLIGGIKQAEDALPGRRLRVAVPCHDEVLVEVLRHFILVVKGSPQSTAGEGGGGEHDGDEGRGGTKRGGEMRCREDLSAVPEKSTIGLVVMETVVWDLQIEQNAMTGSFCIQKTPTLTILCV